MSEGYLRFPTIAGDWIAFVAEDDLWLVPAQGRPRLPPDGGSG
ncbi:MAG: hypothetical protein KatS3mg061_3025 [Dehalococcoidia bacterium]|nr:MAG: hypothetical protein KatS3mg061_3025 [Dehalococcoidia bacterium]